MKGAIPFLMGGMILVTIYFAMQTVGSVLEDEGLTPEEVAPVRGEPMNVPESSE